MIMGRNNASWISIYSLFFLLIFFCLGFVDKAETRKINVVISEEEDLELERQVKMMNKPPVITFQSKGGGTIDCIRINEQPSLDHPLLKNHKIQMQPNSYPKGLQVNESVNFRRLCPNGTVPIKRITKQDLIKAKSFWKQISANTDPNSNYPGWKVVQVKTKYIPERYYGAKGDVSMSNLSLQTEHSSSSNLWIQSGAPHDLNMISAGLIISEALNGDVDIHLFTHWTNDGFNSGCYNMLCKGFVQVHPAVSPGSRMTSDIYYYNQKIMPLLIYQDGAGGNWWLLTGFKPIAVGYWPSERFPYMRNGSNHVGWGGATTAGKGGIWAPMGNGQYANGEFTQSGFFVNVRFIDYYHAMHFPEDQHTEEINESPTCYGLVNRKTEVGGYLFTFGGPGGPSC